MLKIKKAEELSKIHPLSQANLVFWITTVSEEPSFWSRCYEILSRTGVFYVVCEPHELEVVCGSLKKAGFQELELNSWAYPNEEPKRAKISGWEDWGEWFVPSWRPIVVARKRGKSNHRASLVSFYQKPCETYSLVGNLEKWGAGILHIGKDGDKKRDLVLIHGTECSLESCDHGCSIHTMDMNRTGVLPSQNFQIIQWRESDLLDLIKQATTVQGGECLETYEVSEKDFKGISDNYFHSIVAQGNPEKVLSEISRCLRPGGFYVRLASASDTIGTEEDSFLEGEGLLYQGRMALIFEAGACHYTGSKKSFTGLLSHLKIIREASIVGSFGVRAVEKNITGSRSKKGGICEMFGSGD